ncbi:MAG: thiamine kinase [Motiliproteus sp.]|jgi:thiamine kinase
MTADSSPDVSCLYLMKAQTKVRLNAVAQFLAEALDWQPLTAGGSTNGLYRAQAAGQPLVLRLSADEHWAFGVDRQHEAAVLAAIQGYDWAPRVLHNAWQQGWCLMVDEGAAVTPEAADNPVPALLEALAEWQQLDCPLLAQQPFDYPALFAAYRNALLAASHPLAIRVLDRLMQLFTTLPPVPACLTHHDLHWGNLCRAAEATSSGLVVLDWEYAGIANPWFDAAALRSEFGVSAEVIASLPAWRRLHTTEVERGLVTALWLNNALGWLWYQVRGSDRVTTSEHLEGHKLLEAADAFSIQV